MQKYLKSDNCLRSILLFCSLSFCFSAFGQNTHVQDTSTEVAIRNQLTTHHENLRYPLSVLRFYKQSNFKLRWVAPNAVETHTDDAMLLLDCVIQYGLSPSDYHPKNLLYSSLADMANNLEKVNINDRATFDIYLTDAIISFINNVHYGKLNPVFTHQKIDKGFALKLNSESVLLEALKSANFDSTITNVQPRSAEYENLKYQMYMVTGLYILDCYETPEASIRKMAINMERLRWAGDHNKPYILVNTAANKLRLFEPDSTYEFKISPKQNLNQNAVVSNKIDFLKIGEKGQIIFGTNKLKIEHPKKLGGLLLVYDKNAFNITALHAYKKRLIRLKNPIRINIIYLTCEVIEGRMIVYEETSKLDEKLELELYNTPL